MALPEEDRGPAWLRNWGQQTGHTDLDTFSGWVDPNALAVDIKSLVAFADALQKEHELDYRPHVKVVFDEMSALPAQPDARFVELTESMTHHRDMLVQTSTALATHDKAIVAFVNAARAITEEYRGADALSSASVKDVDSTLVVPTATTSSPTATTQPVVTPQQAAQQATVPVSTDPTTTTSPDNGTEYQP